MKFIYQKTELIEAKEAAAKIFEVMERKSEIDIQRTNAKTIDNFNGEISFENVQFSYPSRPEIQILRNLTLKIPFGKTVAFVGSSGTGKSTLFGLLQRFYSPNFGNIKLAGENIQDLNLVWLRDQISFVSQEPVLFSDTIKENIRLGRLDATDEEVIEAAKNSNAHNFIMLTSKKYDTHVGEHGMKLSGGQKQRIALARALLKNPKILLLDEATSALDNESEQIVQNALEKTKQGRTTLIIAHRLSTIKNADLIIGLENGTVKEMGTHDELMQSKGIYYQLVSTQINQEEKKYIELPIDDNQITYEEISKDSTEEESEDRHSIIPDTTQNKKLNNSITKAKKLFYYERRLFKMHRPEIVWLILGVVCQTLHGAVLPGIAFTFSRLYTVIFNCNYDAQFQSGLLYMGIIFGIALIEIALISLYSYSLALVGCRLTTRLRVLMLNSILRQEIGNFLCSINSVKCQINNY